MNIESKYTHKWEDLPHFEKAAAFGKALKAYVKHNSWHRNNDLADAEFKRYKWENPGLGVQGLDCTLARDAKIKCGRVVGRVRRAPRRFRDERRGALVLEQSDGRFGERAMLRSTRTSVPNAIAHFRHLGCVLLRKKNRCRL